MALAYSSQQAYFLSGKRLSSQKATFFLKFVVYKYVKLSMTQIIQINEMILITKTCCSQRLMKNAIKWRSSLYRYSVSIKKSKITSCCLSFKMVILLSKILSTNASKQTRKHLIDCLLSYFKFQVNSTCNLWISILTDTKNQCWTYHWTTRATY